MLCYAMGKAGPVTVPGREMALRRWRQNDTGVWGAGWGRG